MEGDFLPRKEHEIFCELMKSENERRDDENNRQNKRISVLEDTVRQIGALALSVEKLATNMENMLKSIDTHGKFVEAGLLLSYNQDLLGAEGCRAL